MKANLMGRFLNFVGVVDEEDEEEVRPDSAEVAAARDGGWEEEMPHRRRASLVSLPGNNRSLRVVVMNPHDLEDGQAIADQVKGRRPVIVNLEQADERNSQRLLNFLSGVAYALDGGLRKVGEGIFLITPANVEVSAAEPEGQEAWNRGVLK